MYGGPNQLRIVLQQDEEETKSEDGERLTRKTDATAKVVVALLILPQRENEHNAHPWIYIGAEARDSGADLGRLRPGIF